MRVKYSPSQKLYNDYYTQQSGFGLPVYIGGMRGRGLGSVLSGLFRAAVPLMKKTGKALLKEGVSSGLNIVQDVLSGRNLKQSVKKRVKSSGKRLIKKAIGEYTAPPGEPVVKRIKRGGKTNSSKQRRDIFR